MAVGLLGGSFNPPHRGHLALARTVMALGLAERVILIPAAAPPHKAAPREADAATRLAMAELLAAEHPGLEVSGLELERAGPSFTVDTVRRLMADHPGVRYRLIIGSDLAKTFATWREYRQLLLLVPPLVAERPDNVFSGLPEEEFPGMSGEEIATMLAGRFAMRPVNVSSTMVRRLLEGGAGDGEMLAYLTGPVLRFIRERRLYRSAEGR